MIPQLVNQRGNFDDVRISLQLNNYSLEHLEAAIQNEKAKPQPRQTVIKLIEKYINKNVNEK
ncbi:hypothetical protein [Rufibacter quisquiliarum]|uniref:Uncharacterized protein n=1 Tax=Rufibacter quisquiliarum TaxID=1549639 RepID=A0A839GJC3_9BACT|nr:hypothetical protein [Rufibacter quisquiliarum]MBA9078962.1 hypothetical protein [Rufibacter quisquiliarum]